MWRRRDSVEERRDSVEEERRDSVEEGGKGGDSVEEEG